MWKKTGEGTISGPAASSAGNKIEEPSELWWWDVALLELMAIEETVVGNRHIETAGKEAA